MFLKNWTRLSVIGSALLLMIPSAQGSSCACGTDSFLANFSISSQDPHDGDKAVFTGEVSSRVDDGSGNVNGADSPDDRTATYDSPAHFWVVGAPAQPIYTVTVTSAASNGTDTPLTNETDASQRHITVTLPCGFEYRFISGSGSSDSGSASWQSGCSVTVDFDVNGESTKSFEIRVTLTDEEGGATDSQEVGGEPRLSGHPEVRYIDSSTGQFTSTGERGFSLQFPLGRLTPSGTVERRTSAGSLTLSATDDIADWVDISNFTLNASSSVGDLPPPVAPATAHVYEDLNHGGSYGSPHLRRFVSPTAIIDVEQQGSNVIWVNSYANSDGRRGSNLGYSYVFLSPTSSVPGADHEVEVYHYSSLSGVTTHRKIATNGPSNGGIPSLVSIQNGDRRSQIVVQELGLADAFNRITESQYTTSGSSEVCTNMTVSEYTYDGNWPFLRSRRYDLDGIATTDDGPYEEWTYYSASQNPQRPVRSHYSSIDKSWSYYGYYQTITGQGQVIYSPYLSQSMPVDTPNSAISNALGSFTTSNNPLPIAGTRRVHTMLTWGQSSQSRVWTRQYITDVSGTDSLNNDSEQTPQSIRVHPEVTLGSDGHSAIWTTTERGAANSDGSNFQAVNVSQSASHWKVTRTTGTIGLGGNSIGAPASFQVHPNLSKRDVVISGAYGPIVSYTEIYNGSTFDSVNRASTAEYDYDTQGRLTEIRLDGRVFSQFNYPTPPLWNTHILEYWNVAGIKTVFTFDQDEDLISSVRGEGQANTPIITTEYVRDGLTTSLKINGDTVGSTTFDRLGRVLSSVDEIGRLNSYSYSYSSKIGGGQNITVTSPGGVSVTQDYYMDGLPISTTGNALVDTHFSYALEQFTPGNGDHVLAITRSSLTPSSSRYTKALTDASGYRTLTIKPTVKHNSVALEKTLDIYNPYNNIISKQSHLGDVDQDVELGGRVGHPVVTSQGVVTPAGAMGMAVVYGVHDRGESYLVDTDRNYTVSSSEYALITHPTEGNVWAAKTTTTRTLSQHSGTPGSNYNLQTTDTQITWRALNQAAGDFQKVEANGIVTTSETIFDFANATITQTQHSPAYGTSTTQVVAGYVVSTTSSLSDGATTLTEYDDRGRVIRFVNLRGRASQTVYNELGQVILIRDHDGGEHKYSYYPSDHQNAGMLWSLTDPLGKTSVYTYNQRGQLLSQSGSATYPVNYTYNAYGELNTLVANNENGNSLTKWSYHPNRVGLVTSKILGYFSAQSETNTFTYQEFGLPLTQQYGAIHSKEFEINSLGDITNLKHLKNGQVDTELLMTYNSYGSPNYITQKLRHPLFGASRRNISYHRRYYQNGMLAEETRNAIGGINNSSSDHRPMSSRMKYFQDSSNRTRQKSHQIEIPQTPNVSGWKIIGATEYGYDSKGRLSTVGSNDKGSLVQNSTDLIHTYTYHANTAIPHTITSNNGVEDIFKSTYNVNRLGQTIDVLSHALPTQGNVLGLRAAVGYQYNKLGQRIRATRENGDFWKYEYDDRGAIASAKKYQSGSAGGQILGGLQFEYQYDNMGNRISMAYGGDEKGEGLRSVDYAVNNRNQYIEIDNAGYFFITGMSGLTGNPLTPGVIEVNNEQAQQQGAYFFKELSENTNNGPVSVPVTLKETPHNGSAVTTSHGDIYVPVSNVNPVYEYGNLKNDGRWIYTWDSQNQLQRMEPTPAAIAAHAAAGHSDPLPVLDFLYDWRGRRISKRVTTGTGSGASRKTTTFIYDAWNIVASIETESHSSEFTCVRSIWGLDVSRSHQGAGGVGGLLATRTSEMEYEWFYTRMDEQVRHFPSYDGSGNVIAWTTDDGGAEATRDYDAYGNVLTTQGSRWSSSTPYGFATKYEDIETELLYYGYRYYDSKRGRWLSREPLGEGENINLYSYCHGDPINNVDVLGLATHFLGESLHASESTFSSSSNTSLIEGLGLTGSETHNSSILVAQRMDELRAAEVFVRYRKQIDEYISSEIKAVFDARNDFIHPDGPNCGDVLFFSHSDWAARGRAYEAQQNIELFLNGIGINTKSTALGYDLLWYANQDIDQLILRLVYEVGVPNDPYHFLTRFSETASAIPSVLEYFVREVTSFNSVSRLVLGAEFAPGFAGIEDVGAQGRLYSGLELVLFSSFPAGRSGGVTHTRSFARCTGSGASNSGPRGVRVGSNNYGGHFDEIDLSNGGTNWLSTGEIDQTDISNLVNVELGKFGQKRNIDIISGSHGATDRMSPNNAMFRLDQATFGDTPGVTVHDVTKLSPVQIKSLLNNDNVTIGGFCDSNSCLTPFLE